MTSTVVLALSLALYFIVIFVVLMVIDNKIDKLLKPMTNKARPLNLKEVYNGRYIGECPSCQRMVEFAQKHCHNCCQLLDWTEVLEMPCKDD